ncbi:MAG: tagaturonate reductase [Oscillospiraceae bacterium]
MERLSEKQFPRVSRPVRAVQFGEGNFLRAFVDYFIDIANEKGVTDMGVAVVKPIPMGSLDSFREQDNLFTVCLRGRMGGAVVDDSRIVSCIEQVVDPYADFAAYDELALGEELRFVFSNTTEAGIVYDESDSMDGDPPKTFPGKLTRLLHRRFTHFGGGSDKGLIVIPCELIERNGDNLHSCVKKLSALWALGEEFDAWVEESCVFCNTLVDRIVTGYPRGKGEAEALWEKLGYQDTLLDVAEPFGLWVIESRADKSAGISAELPLDKAGLPVLFTADQTPYRERKVRILNGAHTVTVPAAFLAGEDIVRDCMADPTIRGFMERALNDEILPTLTLPAQEVRDFAASVLERFENPFIDHALLSITLNSVSKWKARVLPSFRDSVRNTGKLPDCMTFSLAALIALYNGNSMENGALMGSRNGQPYAIQDDAPVLEFFLQNSALPATELAEKVLSNTAFWSEDLTAYEGFAEKVARYLEAIRQRGTRSVMEELVK